MTHYHSHLCDNIAMFVGPWKHCSFYSNWGCQLSILPWCEWGCWAWDGVDPGQKLGGRKGGRKGIEGTLSIRDICHFVDTGTIFNWHQKHTNSRLFDTLIHNFLTPASKCLHQHCWWCWWQISGMVARIISSQNVYCIWFVWSETSYSGDERRSYRCGTNDKKHWR